MSNDNVNVFERLLKLWVAICKMCMDGTRNPSIVANYMQRIIDPNLSPVEPVCSWCKEEDGTVHLRLIANGWSGERWVRWFNGNGVTLSRSAKSVLESSAFKPTPSGVPLDIVVLSSDATEDLGHLVRKIQQVALDRNLEECSIDTACLFAMFVTKRNLADMRFYGVACMSTLVEKKMLGATQGDITVEAYDKEFSTVNDLDLYYYGFAFKSRPNSGIGT